MAFTVRDFQDLVRLLREHPEWREELRALLLSAELLSLPELVRGLGEKLDRLSAAQLKAEERLARLEELVAELAQAQARTEERLAELAHAQARTEAALERLTATMTTLVEAQRRTEADVGELKGISLELRWRERAPAYLAKLLR